MGAGRFREDLLARLNLRTYQLPGLAGRREDIQPNLDFELERWQREQRQHVGFNREDRARYLAFAASPDGRWSGNFCELGRRCCGWRPWPMPAASKLSRRKMRLRDYAGSGGRRGAESAASAAGRGGGGGAGSV